jgi:dihydroflavonol-4-reductase
MRILLTGATGFLGNNLARQLLAEGHEILAAIRHSSDPRPLSELKLETIHLDLANPSEVNLAASDCDLIIHSAAIIHIGWTKLDASRNFNVESTRVLAAAARRKSVRMILISTVDTLAVSDGKTLVTEEMQTPAKPPCAYVVSKRESEMAFLSEVDQGLDGVIVNPGFMVGPYDWKPSSGKMMLTLKKQPILFFAPGGGCSVVDVRDVAAGIVSAITHGRSGQRYILGGHNLSYLELWAMMATTMNKRPPVRRMRNWLAAAVGGAGDLWTNVSGREGDVNSASTKIGQMHSWYSSQKAETELGYRIGSVEDALADAWDWFGRQ